MFIGIVGKYSIVFLLIVFVCIILRNNGDKGWVVCVNLIFCLFFVVVFNFNLLIKCFYDDM